MLPIHLPMTSRVHEGRLKRWQLFDAKGLHCAFVLVEARKLWQAALSEASGPKGCSWCFGSEEAF